MISIIDAFVAVLLLQFILRQLAIEQLAEGEAEAKSAEAVTAATAAGEEGRRGEVEEKTLGTSPTKEDPPMRKPFSRGCEPEI